ncbi:hypothetical protein P9112_012089 [Eukaryota sp. TZLM1-RC]
MGTFDISTFLSTPLSNTNVTKLVSLLSEATSLPSHGSSLNQVLTKMESILTTFVDRSSIHIRAAVCRCLVIIAEQRSFEAARAIDLLTAAVISSDDHCRVAILHLVVELFFASSSGILNQFSGVAARKILTHIAQSLNNSESFVNLFVSLLVELISPSVLKEKHSELVSFITFILSKCPREPTVAAGVDPLHLLSSTVLNCLAKELFNYQSNDDVLNLEYDNSIANDNAKSVILSILPKVSPLCLMDFTDSLVKHLETVTETLLFNDYGKIVSCIFELLDVIKTLTPVSVFQDSWEKAYLA